MTSTEPRYREQIPMPKRFEVQDDGDELVIKSRWNPYVGIFWSLVTLFLLTISVLFFFKFTDAEMIIKVLVGITLLIGLFLAYVSVCHFVNTTLITVRRGVLSFTHIPLPYFGQVQFQASEIDQLYVKEEAHQISTDGDPSRQSKVIFLTAVFSDGTKRRISSGFENLEQAVYVEQILEKHLGITDRPVKGEAKI